LVEQRFCKAKVPSPSLGGGSARKKKPVRVWEAAPAQTGILHTARYLLIKARVSIQDRKRKKREKIMAALNTKSKITNDEVEKLLHVSDATAERYLAVLVKEGKLKQEKRTGADVSYSRTQ
jgi:predicted HTH transcriptional regulator